MKKNSVVGLSFLISFIIVFSLFIVPIIKNPEFYSQLNKGILKGLIYIFKEIINFLTAPFTSDYAPYYWYKAGAPMSFLNFYYWFLFVSLIVLAFSFLIYYTTK